MLQRHMVTADSIIKPAEPLLLTISCHFIYDLGISIFYTTEVVGLAHHRQSLSVQFNVLYKYKLNFMDDGVLVFLVYFS